MTDSREYLVHDYSILNRHVEEGAVRAQQISNYQRSLVWKNLLKWGAIFLVGVGVAAVLLAFAYRILIGTMQVERRLPMFEESAAKKAANSLTPEGIVVEDFNKFTTIPFGRAGFSSVVIGRKYVDEYQQSPSSQWCYMQRPDNIEGSAIKISLLEKKGDREIEIRLTQALADKHGISLADLHYAKSLCRFD